MEVSRADMEREALWVESVRRYRARQSEDLNAAWCEYHRKMRAVHWGLGDEHDAELQKLENGHRRGGDAEEVAPMR